MTYSRHSLKIAPLHKDRECTKTDIAGSWNVELQLL
jgi:hypothetical protein